MKHPKIILALVATALLSTAAAAHESADPVLASFERNMNYEPAAHIAQPAQVETDPLTEAIVAALRGSRRAEIRAISAATPQSSRGVGSKGG